MFKISDIVFATDGILLNGDMKSEITSITLDSRTASKGMLFICIVGENFDGHDFIDKAYLNGTRSFLVNHDIKCKYNDCNIIKVLDTTLAYGAIAKYYREKFDIKYVAVTGSCGKTSTKDYIYSVLKKKYNTLRNDANHNNEIGLPRTILKLDKKNEVCITEMGMQHPLEIKYLCNIVRPNIGVITNIGLSHIEFFKNQDGIFDAKMEITSYFNKDSILIVNGDDKYLKTLKNKELIYKLLSYGFDKNNDIYCKSYEIKDNKTYFSCIYDNKSYDFEIAGIAKHNILNSMASILVGFCLSLSYEQIKDGLKNAIISSGRLTVINNKKYTIIDDTYNSSLDSCISALEVLKSYNERKVAIIGDILEAGAYAIDIHKKIGSLIKDKCDVLVTVGDCSKNIDIVAQENGFLNIYHYDNYSDLIKNINKIINNKDVILLKASHGIELSKVVKYLNEN